MNGPDRTLLGAPAPPSRPAHWSRRKVTQAQAEEIRRRFADGETCAALALEFGVSTQTIRYWADARGRA